MRRQGTVRGLGIAVTCGALALGAAQPASASRIVLAYGSDSMGYELSYIGQPGEANVVTHKAAGGSAHDAASITITDTGATIGEIPAGACLREGPHQVTCRPDPTPEAYPFANGLAECATGQQPARPSLEDCDTDFADRGFGQLIVALNDGDDVYASTPGTIPISVHVYSTSGDDVIEISGEGFASAGGGDGRDRLVLGPLAAEPGIGYVQGWGAEDRISVRNGRAGDRVRCGEGIDPEPKIDPGDFMLPEHGCEEVPEDAVLIP